MKRNVYLLLAAYALSAIVVFPLSQWSSTGWCDAPSFMVPVVLYCLPVAIGLLVLPVVVLGLLAKSTRRRSLMFLVCLPVLIVCTQLGIVLGSAARSAGIREFAERSLPLIAAIEEHVKDRSDPPSTLGDLVPDYLDAVPHTGMSAYPEFEYVSGNDCARAYAGNRWVLIVRTPAFFMNWDFMLYLPNHNYTEYGYAGRSERIGEWAYFHE